MTDEPMFLSRDGKPMETMEWAEAYENPDIRVVRAERPNPEVLISTIWEGINMSGRYGIFDTAILVDGEIIFSVRSATEEEAIRTHENTVDSWARGEIEDARKS